MYDPDLFGPNLTIVSVLTTFGMSTPSTLILTFIHAMSSYTCTLVVYGVRRWDVAVWNHRQVTFLLVVRKVLTLGALNSRGAANRGLAPRFRLRQVAHAKTGALAVVLAAVEALLKRCGVAHLLFQTCFGCVRLHRLPS